ncbi:hypothetical protein J968_3946, partial [Acinetobacter baumannii 26016_2]
MSLTRRSSITNGRSPTNFPSFSTGTRILRQLGCNGGTRFAGSL